MGITIKTRPIGGSAKHKALLEKACDFLQSLLVEHPGSGSVLGPATVVKHAGSYSVLAPDTPLFAKTAVGTVVAKAWIARRSDLYIRDCEIKFFPRDMNHALLLGIDLTLPISKHAEWNIKAILAHCGFTSSQFGSPVSILPHEGRLFTPIIVEDVAQLDVLLKRTPSRIHLWL